MKQTYICHARIIDGTGAPVPPSRDYGCVIMASGLGKRFGSNKLLADFCEEPLIGRILHATEDIFFRRVVVTRHEAVADLCEKHGIDVVFHCEPYLSDTIRLGLEAVGNVTGCMFCPADQPLLRRETIRQFLSAAAADRERIWRVCHRSTPGSPVIFPRWTFSELLTLPEDKGGSFVIKKYPDRVSFWEVSDAFELLDVDTPDTLKQLQNLCQNKKD